MIDGANAEERREHEPGDQGADNPHHDIQEQALLRIGAHMMMLATPGDAPMIIHRIKFMARFSPRMSKGCRGSDRCAGPLSYYPMVRLTYRESARTRRSYRGNAISVGASGYV